ncbi:hypothetical protein GCM10025864_20970 [Luteimicrobium album]|uniref:NlpC/P60 domain-containing protein n=1 Tax=Luteimicrobium album TaxID=1054550 RepID=A0ABQ6I313_9MICO|nr:hypothetical protein GCM10025864_20970 [Luteimicrobium album]
MRPEGGRPRRFGRVATTAGLLVGLVGGGLVTTAAATPAAAATTATKTATAAKPKTVKATVSLKISDKSYYKNKPPLVSVSSKAGGKATTGKVWFWVAGKHVKTVTLKHGKATYRLSKGLKPGHHRVRATIHPSSKYVKGTTRYTTVLTHKYSSRVVEKAVKYTGTRYVYGGSSPRGFDCSGFTKYVYSHTKVKSLPARRRASATRARSCPRSTPSPVTSSTRPGTSGSTSAATRSSTPRAPASPSTCAACGRRAGPSST